MTESRALSNAPNLALHHPRSRCVRTVRELSAYVRDHALRSVYRGGARVDDCARSVPNVSDRRSRAPEFNFQWAWSSGTVAGRAAAGN